MLMKLQGSEDVDTRVEEGGSFVYFWDCKISKNNSQIKK